MTYSSKKIDIIPGFWYDAAPKSDPAQFGQIKITKDGFINVNGWKIVARGENIGNNISIWWAPTIEECERYIKDTFLYEKPSKSLLDELKADSDFLKRDVHSKCWEIAQHIDYVISNILGD